MPTKQPNSKCQVCLDKELNWLHEESCRAKNPLAWFLLDFHRAKINKDNDAKYQAVFRYREKLNEV